MNELGASLRHNLARLAQFEGRDSKRRFWPWAILVFIAAYAAQVFAMLPWMADAMTRSIALGQALGKQQVDPSTADAQMAMMMRDMMDGLGDLWLPMALIHLVAIALLAAAVTRRLHDRGRSGGWGLIPLPFAAVSIANMPKAGQIMMNGNATSRELLMMTLGYLFWIALIVLVVLLVRDGDKGPNDFGPAPDPVH